MHINDLSGKRVCIVGFGREGQAMLQALHTYAPKAVIEVRDQSNKQLVTSNKLATFVTGEKYLENLDQFDVIIVSPGIKPNEQRATRNAQLTSSTQIFLDSIADTGATVIGVTGSKGKSTTASLIHAILKADKKKSFLIGNIGFPAIKHLKDAKKNTFFVQEISSYQLMNLNISPHIAVITSFFPEHLDYHGGIAAYFDAKANIVRHQNIGDIVIYNAENEGATRMAMLSKGEKVGYRTINAPLPLNETKLLGEHNLLNMAAAALVAERLGIRMEIIKKALADFSGLPHRLEDLGCHHDIRWIDDAISTTPESSIAALKALGKDVSTIILGGQDRGTDFTKLAAFIARSHIQNVVLIGETAKKIETALINANAKAIRHTAASMREIVDIAKRVTQNGSICLLSTAAPSYDMFMNFEVKGEEFKRCIES